MNIDLYKTFLYNYKNFIENIPIDDDIPNSVTHLTLGNIFNQPLKKDDIPTTVTHLTFDSYFNHQLNKNDIPNSVTHLTLGNMFNKS
jgi:hypothetical protein